MYNNDHFYNDSNNSNDNDIGSSNNCKDDGNGKIINYFPSSIFHGKHDNDEYNYELGLGKSK